MPVSSVSVVSRIPGSCLHFACTCARACAASLCPASLDGTHTRARVHAIRVYALKDRVPAAACYSDHLSSLEIRLDLTLQILSPSVTFVPKYGTYLHVPPIKRFALPKPRFPHELDFFFNYTHLHLIVLGTTADFYGTPRYCNYFLIESQVFLVSLEP